MTQGLRILMWLSLCALLSTVLASCATNPVTGKSDLVLMSEDQEIAIGREMHPKILDQKGEYDDSTLQAYVQQIGESLARVSHRTDLVYRFTVIDSPQVNAFALPGGYIYIERGLLAYLNSEAELAAVLGHELGHVTARHTVRQHSAAATTGVLGSIIASSTGIYGAQDVANIAGTALVRGYGREHELEADRLGAEYLARAGYDPQAMLNVIRVLKNQEQFEIQRAKEEGRDPRSYHGLFSTHPDNDTRLKTAIAAAEKFRATTVQRPANRDVFLKHIDGMAFGESDREGVRRGNRFYHRELDTAIEFPTGWALENLPDRIVAESPSKDGLIQFTMEDLNTRLSVRQFMVQRLGLKQLSNEQKVTHGGMEGYTAIAPRRTQSGERLVRYVVFYRSDKALVFAGLSKKRNTPYKYDAAVLATARSLHRLTNSERELAGAQRIHVVRAAPGARYSRLARASVIPNHPEAQLRLLNGQYPRGEPQSGSLLKIVE